MPLDAKDVTKGAPVAVRSFTHSAHFARLHRETFGVTPSYMVRKIARVGNVMSPASRRGRTAVDEFLRGV